MPEITLSLPMALGALVALPRVKFNSAWLILGGGLLGILIHLLT